MKLSVIIPIWNEAQFIAAVIGKIKSVTLPAGITKEIIMINDGSTDETREVLEKYKEDPSMRVFHRHTRNGKTSAVKLGIQMATGDIILIQDGDLEYNPDEYPALIEPIIAGRASVVYGSRFKGTIKGMHFINRFANIISNLTVNLLFNAKITDINTGYKVFTKSALSGINLASKEFAFETEITSKLLKRGHAIYEVPISYVARSKKEGKKITWMKAIEMYWGIIKWRGLS
jgi:glycosyltransferase involved in cell wall biosynthesis